MFQKGVLSRNRKFVVSMMSVKNKLSAIELNIRVNLSTMLIILFFSAQSTRSSAQAKVAERRIERFYVAANGGIVFPITGDYKKMAIGSNYIVEGGFRWKINDRGGLAWSIGYSGSKSTIIRETDYYNGFYTGPIEVEDNISISRFDISLLDLFKLYGKNNEGYFHVAINLVFNQNTFTNKGTNTSGVQAFGYSEKQKSEVGFATEYGLHMPVSDHFGISLDVAAVIIKLGEKKTSYITYSTTTTTAQGFYGYVNLGLVYGIW